MVITTASGSKYTFTVKDNEIHFLNGLKEGVVSSLSGLEVGSNLEIHFLGLNPQTYEKSEELSYIRTTPIVSIE